MLATNPRQLTPWWAWLLAAAFLVWLTFGFYTSLTGVVGPGAAASDAPSGGTLIEEVVPGKPMEQAGVRAGDIIVAVDGQAIRGGHDWGEMAWQFEPEKPFVLTVERDGQQMQLTLLFPHLRVWEERNRKQVAGLLSERGTCPSLWGDGAGGIVRPAARPRCGRRRRLAAHVRRPSGTGEWRRDRRDVSAVALPSASTAFVISTLLGGYLVLVFAALYARPVFRRRWILPVLLLPALLVILFNVFRLYHRFYMPAQAISPGPPWAFQLALAVEIANILAGLIVLVLGFKRLKEAHERRNLGRVLLATLISFGAMVVYFWLLSSEPSSPVLRQIYKSQATGFAFLALWSVFPVAFAQAVLRSASRPASTTADSQ